VLQPFLTSQNMIVNTVRSVSIKSMFHMVFSLKLAYILQFIHCLLIFCLSKINKRAKRALGRSHEEKVKGQGKAIYRGQLMLSTKYW